MRNDNTNTVENNVEPFITISINVAKMKEKARKLVTIEGCLMLPEDASLEDLKATLSLLTSVEKVKLIAWGSTVAKDKEVRKYCRVRSGGAVGVAAVVTGALYYYCS